MHASGGREMSAGAVGAALRSAPGRTTVKSGRRPPPVSTTSTSDSKPARCVDRNPALQAVDPAWTRSVSLCMPRRHNVNSAARCRKASRPAGRARRRCPRPALAALPAAALPATGLALCPGGFGCAVWARHIAQEQADDVPAHQRVCAAVLSLRQRTAQQVLSERIRRPLGCPTDTACVLPVWCDGLRH